MRPMRRIGAITIAALAAFWGCAKAETDGLSSGGAAGTGSSTSSGSSSSGESSSSSSSGAPGQPDGLCPVTLRYKPPAGMLVSSVAAAGEWNAFDTAKDPLAGPDASGEYALELRLAPGLHAYKLVLNTNNWILDPGQAYRKYVGGVENSAVRVADCLLPRLEVASSAVGNDSASFVATVRYVDSAYLAGMDAASIDASLRHEGTQKAVTVTTGGDPKNPEINVDLTSLTPGKYTVVLRASDTGGRASEPLRLVFWIEKDTFDWRDALIYMIMTDRYRDGDASNNPGSTAGVTDARADWHGGDLEGVRKAISEGVLDNLGVRAIWLTPFATNPSGAYLASDKQHLVAGYHGYWPVRAREVDARLGGEAALKAMVAEAHAHGIRVLMDFVVNHVHSGHEYFKAHPEWFRTGCVCGTAGCDWTDHRLDCLFADYMPDVNFTVPEVTEQFSQDAVWWLDTFDLDGLRVDAVKHVEDVAVTNLAATVRREFEASGKARYFLMGETAMGWTDPQSCGCNFDANCSVACNQSQYDTISQYIGPFGLDGQFDFVLYHAVPYRVFAYDEQGFQHTDFWTKASLDTYPKGAVMTPYIGSHDTPRSVTLASYRGQDAAHDKGVPGNQWSNVAGPPDGAEPYSRHSLALAWLLGLPGAPLLYYGDEYGQFGGADPGNRADFRSGPALSPLEAATLTRASLLGQARRDLRALRRGAYSTLLATNTFLAFARVSSQAEGGDAAIVALSRSPSMSSTDVTLPAGFPLGNGSVLKDRLGGPDATIAGGKLTIALPAWGAAVLAP